MKQEITAVARRLLAELRNDLPFFALCGMFVGLLMVWQDRLKELGIASGESWPNKLFSDFMSFNAFSLVFFGLIALASATTTLKATGRHWPRLERAVNHVESRLAQLASSIISFTLGVSALALLQSLLTVTAGGAVLFLAVVLFNLLVFGSFVVAVLVARRIEPFDRWWVALLTLCLASLVVAFFIVRGVT